jgi:ketosteroid isomerase-like protein
MLRRFHFSVLVLLVIASGGCAKKVDVEASRGELRAADSEWAQTTANVDGFMSHLAADAVLYPPNQPAVSGADNIRAWVSTMMGFPGFSLNFQNTTVDVGSSGDFGYTAGTYQFSVTGPDGQPMNDNGKYVTVWRKEAGAWKVVADIFNSDLPMPTMPASADTTATPPTGG